MAPNCDKNTTGVRNSHQPDMTEATALVFSPLMTMSEIREAIEKLASQSKRQHRKCLLVRLLTKSHQFHMTIGHLGDKMRNLERLSRDEANFVNINNERLSSVYESSLIYPLSEALFFLSPAFVLVTDHKEKRSISVTIGRLAAHLAKLTEALRQRLGEAQVNQSRYLITLLRQIEQGWIQGA